MNSAEQTPYLNRPPRQRDPRTRHPTGAREDAEKQAAGPGPCRPQEGQSHRATLSKRRATGGRRRELRLCPSMGLQGPQLLVLG